MQNLNNPGIILTGRLKVFVEFLERSCTEFSLPALTELSRRLKDKSLYWQSFNLMSRDEARHAGFLNKATFNPELDLGFLTKSRKYTSLSRSLSLCHLPV